MTVKIKGDSLVFSDNTSQISAAKLGSVVQAVKTNVFSSSTLDVFVDVPGLSLTIVPKNTQSKIYIYLSTVVSGDDNGVGTLYPKHIQLKRNNTVIAVGDARGSSTQCWVGGGGVYNINYPEVYQAGWTDSPNTTNPITYNIQAKSPSGSILFVNGSFNSSDTANASCISTLTAIEVLP